MRKMKLFVSMLLISMLFVSSLNVLAAESNEAKIGQVEYATFEEAVEAASVGDTVVLLSDVTLEAPLTISKSIKN